MFKKIIIISLFIFVVLIFVKGKNLIMENLDENQNFDKVREFIDLKPSLKEYKYAFQINTIPGCSVNNKFGENWRVILKDNRVKDVCIPVSNPINTNNSESKPINIPSEKNKITSKTDSTETNSELSCEGKDKINRRCVLKEKREFGYCDDGITFKISKDGKNYFENKNKNTKNKNVNNNNKILNSESLSDLFLTKQCYKYPEKKNIFANINKRFFQDKCSDLFTGSKYYLPYVDDCTLLGQSKIICSV